jgi:nucleoside-diphosphate-sugar epimerase
MTAMTVRFRRPTLLIVGCGDVGMRVLRLLRGRYRVLALTSTPARRSELREAGAVPLVGNLDDAATLGRLGALADVVLHLAPPPAEGDRDPRTRRLLSALARGGRAQRLVYASTTGVYGDCAGAVIDETRPVAPRTARARRRVDAEARVRHFGRATGVRASILRVPGIYALDREGGDPRQRIVRGTPVLLPEDDVYTSHIHADDLARACVAALHRGAPQRVYHVRDETQTKMGDHFDHVADLAGLPRPPRISRKEAALHLTAMQLTFLSESRRPTHDRMKRELKLVPRYPSIADALAPATRPPSSFMPEPPPGGGQGERYVRPKAKGI